MKARNGVDIAIRVVAVSILGCIAFPLLVFACIMGTDSGTEQARNLSTTVFFLGSAILVLLILLCILAPRIVNRLPGPKIIWSILFRIPSYAIVVAAAVWCSWLVYKHHVHHDMRRTHPNQPPDPTRTGSGASTKP